MLCDKCGKENRSVARFCKWCGERLERAEADPLRELFGMEEVKREVRDLILTCRSLRQRSKESGISVRLSMDALIIGNTGTGKTTLARVLQDQFRANGIVSQREIHLVDAVDWADFCDRWGENIEKCRGGILCIENVQKLLPDGYSDSICELDKLFHEMGKWNNDPIVILSGLPGGFEHFLAMNPAIRNRFRYLFRLDDFTEEELYCICEKRLRERFGLVLTGEATVRLRAFFKHALKNRDESFGNGHLAIEKAESIFTAQLNRTVGRAGDNEVLPEDIRGEVYETKGVEEVMKVLDRFVGLDNIKSEVRQTLSYIDIEKIRNGGKFVPVNLHYVFTGNPGTGKTTVARVMAEIFRAKEVLVSGHLVETDRAGLVGQYQGQTAVKTNELVDRALGGVLFIDEAYNLVQGEHDSFGKEAVNTLLKRLEDDKGKFVCIVAGYSKEMSEFLDVNPGLKSRFNRTLEFRDYSAEELERIFRNLVAGDSLRLDKEADEGLTVFFKKMYAARDRNFGNAREVVKAYELAKNRQGGRLDRILLTPGFNVEMLSILRKEDIEGSEGGGSRSLAEVLADLNEFVGMGSVKEAIGRLARKAEFDRVRAERGVGGAELTEMHIVLTGNPGTGKTTIARKLGEVFKAIGVLPTDKVVEADRSLLVGQYQGETPKLVNKLCDLALGGVLFIDEAYALSPADGDKYGTEAIETLLKRMEDDRGKFVVIAAGYRREMDHFLRTNPGLESRFAYRLHIDDYTVGELVEIYRGLAAKKAYVLSEEAELALRHVVEQKVAGKGPQFGNAREMRMLLDETLQRLASRLLDNGTGGLTGDDLSTIMVRDIPRDEAGVLDVEACLAELDELVGLEGVKQAVRDMANYLNVERKRALATGKVPEGVKDHIVFTGNPGTGKTTVARIMGRVFRALGMLPSGHLVEADRGSLVAGYTGQTAIKTNRLIDSALGGVLFIDEAYTLAADAETGGFGQEAIDTLLKRLEDDRGRFICIVAGYPRNMQQFIGSNPGLQSRFSRVIHFEDYGPKELVAIFEGLAARRGVRLTPGASRVLPLYFEEVYAGRDALFGNAREVRKRFDRALMRQGNRLAGRTDVGAEDMLWLEAGDIDACYDENGYKGGV